jgi:2,5-furandicarboxylate decarboxylase 1
MEYEGEIPCLRGINYRNLSGVVIVQIDKKSEEDVKKTIDLFFSHWFTVLLIITDVDVDIRDPRQVDWALATRVRPERDITVKSDQPAMTINPVAVVSGEITLRLSPPWVPLTAKIAIDATKPLEERERFERIDIPQAVKEKVSTLLQGSI